MDLNVNAATFVSGKARKEEIRFYWRFRHWVAFTTLSLFVISNNQKPQTVKDSENEKPLDFVVAFKICHVSAWQYGIIEILYRDG